MVNLHLLSHDLTFDLESRHFFGIHVLVILLKKRDLHLIPSYLILLSEQRSQVVSGHLDSEHFILRDSNDP
jgi:hypothetical protein